MLHGSLLQKTLATARRYGTWAWALPFAATIATQLYLASYYKPAAPLYDSAENFAMAYNILKYGVFSVSDSDNAFVESDYMREPVYPAMLALVLKMSGNVDKADLICFLIKKDCAWGLQAFFWLNVAILVAISIAAYFAAWSMTRSRPAAALAMAIVALTPNLMGDIFVVNTELPAALWLTLHSLFLYKTFFSHRSILNGTLAGVFLGLLILTKAVFTLWLVALGFLIVVVFFASRQRVSIIGFACLIVSATIIVTPWTALKMEHDAKIKGENPLDDTDKIGRIGGVLKTRASYSTMNWDEYAAGYVYYTPYVGPTLAEEWFGRDIARRFNRTDPESFWAKGFSLRNSTQVIAQNWMMNISLAPLFAYRGAFIGGCCTLEGNTVPQYPIHVGIPYVGPVSDRLHAVFVIISLLYFPFLFAALIIAAKRRYWPILLFSAPASFSYGFYSLVTHNLPRYSQPLTPILVVVMMWVIYVAWTKISSDWFANWPSINRKLRPGMN